MALKSKFEDTNPPRPPRRRVTARMRNKCAIPLVEHLPVNRLPSEIQVLGHYLWLRNQIPRSQPKEKYAKVSAAKTAKAVQAIWSTAYIPAANHENIMKILYFNTHSLVKR